MKITIHITKEIYRRSYTCSGVDSRHNCAIALAVREIAPNAVVTYKNIYWDGLAVYDAPMSRELPFEAQDLIVKFDVLTINKHKRLALPELSFEVDFPDKMVNTIGINELKFILEKSDSLEAII